MANIRDRCGAVHIRVGGNTQEYATLVDSLPDGEILQKSISAVNNPVRCPFCCSEMRRIYAGIPDIDP